MAKGVSVARVARAHGINANQVYAWRRLYERGLLGVSPATAALVPVRIAEPAPVSEPRQTAASAIHIDCAKGRVDVTGAADPATLRLVLEYLLG